MHLITMAHLGEAQGLIEKFGLKRLENNLFQNEQIFLLITGEGPFEAASQTSHFLGREKIESIINLGIAGSLHENIKLGEIYPVRSVYLFQEQTPAYKSFSGQGEFDCITSFERILKPEKAQTLKGLAQLVDREAWGVAYAAKNFGIPFKCFKLISDYAGTVGACEMVKEEAREWSFKLAHFLEKMLEVKSQNNSSEVIELPGFHFTFTTQQRLKNLITKLAIKKETTSDEILSSLSLSQWQELEVLPKERARLLLQSLEAELDPTKAIIEKEKEQWLKTFKQHGIYISTDPEWEKTEVTLSFQVKSDAELKEMATKLMELSVSPYQKILEGQFHVE